MYRFPFKRYRFCYPNKEEKEKGSRCVMFCKNCGSPLADGAKFCANCGTPVAPPTAPQDPGPASDDPIKFPGAGFPGDDVPVAEPPVSDTSAPAEDSPAPDPSAPAEDSPAPDLSAPAESSPTADAGAPAADAALPVSAPTSTLAYAPPATDGGADSSPTKRRGKAGLVVLGVGAVVVIAVVVLLVNLLGGLFSGGGKAVYAYRNDDNELMFLADLKEKTEALELTDEADYSSNVRFSPDGKTIYFTDADSTLYGIAAAELKKGSKPERISRDVGSFNVLDDGRLIYIQYDGETKLYVYDKGESYRLLRGYSEYRLSQDQKTIYYTEEDDADDTITLYKISIAKDAKEERLLKGATNIYTSWDADTLVYGVDDNPGGGYATSSDSSADRNTLTVYSCTPGGDRTKLIDDIYSISGVSVGGGKVSFYYYVEDVEERTLYDFVTDAKAGADASTLSEPEPVYPYSYDYSPHNYSVLDDTTIEYYDYNGNRYTLDVSGLLSPEHPTAYDVYMYTYNVEALAREEAQARYDEARADYDARYETWSEAENREYIRESLKDTTYNQSSFSLYHYTGSDKSDPIATQISSSGRGSSPSNGVFLYHKVSLEGGKVADVDELDYASQVREKLNSGAGDDDWYQNVGGKESVISDLEDVTSIYGIYVLNGKEVVLDVDDDGENVLMAFSLGSDALTFTSTIVDDEFSGPYWGQSSGKDVLYLFTDVDTDSNGTAGDLSVYKDGKLETIAKEVYGAAILDQNGATYLVTDLDNRNSSVELATLKDGKTTTISDEVSGDLIFLDDTQLLYISDGDLTLWDGKEERQIARDVEAFWVSVSEAYTAYSPEYGTYSPY